MEEIFWHNKTPTHGAGFYSFLLSCPRPPPSLIHKSSLRSILFGASVAQKPDKKTSEMNEMDHNEIMSTHMQPRHDLPLLMPIKPRRRKISAIAQMRNEAIFYLTNFASLPCVSITIPYTHTSTHMIEQQVSVSVERKNIIDSTSIFEFFMNGGVSWGARRDNKQTRRTEWMNEWVKCWTCVCVC